MRIAITNPSRNHRAHIGRGKALDLIATHRAVWVRPFESVRMLSQSEQAQAIRRAAAAATEIGYDREAYRQEAQGSRRIRQILRGIPVVQAWRMDLALNTRPAESRQRSAAVEEIRLRYRSSRRAA